MRYLINLTFSMVFLISGTALAAEETKTEAEAGLQEVIDDSKSVPKEISATEVGETENADISVTDSTIGGGGLNLEKEAFAGLTLRETLGYGGLSSGAVLILGGYLALHFQKDTTAKYDADENQVTVYFERKGAPAYTMMSVGGALAAGGAFFLWGYPLIFGGSPAQSADLAITTNGSELVLMGSF